MQSQASAVETYIDEAPADRRAGLRLLRKLCRDALDGFEEELRFGMPSYVRDDAVEIAFASQKRYISFYVLRRAALELQADRLRSLSVGEGASASAGSTRSTPTSCAPCSQRPSNELVVFADEGCRLTPIIPIG